MPIVPAHVKLARRKASKTKESLESSANANAANEVVDGVASLSVDSISSNNNAEGRGSSPPGDLEEKGEERRVGDEKSEATTTSSVFAALNAHAGTPNTTVMDMNKEMVVPAPKHATSSDSNLKISSSVEKLNLKRALLYPMQGVEATENNDGMAPAAGSGNQQSVETRFVSFDTLQSRNVSLAKGMVADEKFNAIMGGVMLDIIQENRTEASTSLNEATKAHKRTSGSKNVGGLKPGPTGLSGHGVKPAAGTKPAAVNVNGGASNSLKSLLKIAPGAGANVGGNEDLSFNGGMNILDMLKNAKTAPTAGTRKSKQKGANVNWQQEALMQQTSQVQQQQQGGEREDRRRSSKAYEEKQKQLVKAYHKSAAEGKGINYASSAAFNSPDVSEVPLPDFTGDMQEATFAKGGFFD